MMAGNIEFQMNKYNATKVQVLLVKTIIKVRNKDLDTH